jgi:LmbE family N-acetylglucosaminyl deacetylase
MAAADEQTRLVGVFAHPDDDVYTIGGTWRLLRDRLDVTLVFCTSGDAGPIWVEGIATRETLSSVREGEQAASMAALGVEADVRFLHHPDYHLPEVPFEELVGELVEVLEGVGPQLVITFGPDGLTGHHDHARAGEAADEAFARALARDGDGSARLLHVAVPSSSVERFDRELRALGDPAREPRSLLALRGVDDGSIAVAVDIGAAVDAKLAALEAHRTQIGELERVPEALRWIFLEREWFTQAWPERPAPPAAPATSILEGVDGG